MSQHNYATTYAGQPVNIMMGWDRPLQGYFLVIELSESRAEGCVYSNLEDPALFPCMGMPDSLDHFLEKLDELNIAVPQAMIQQIEVDAALNVGNRYVRYASNGTIVREINH
jgi:hypothetical protein